MQDRAAPKDQLDVESVLGMGQEAAKPWWRRGRSLGIIAAILGMLLLAVFWPFSGSSEATSYVAEPVARGGLTVIVTATGSVEPTNKVDVSSELSGMVRNVLVDYNSPVKVGQVLAELDVDKLKATVDAAKAKVAVAKANIAEAEATKNEKEREFARKQALSDRKVASIFEFEAARAARDRANAAVESAKAGLASAEADLKLAETNLLKTCICSPINGVVLARNVDPGQTVASSFQAPVLFEIAEDLTQMELQVDVDEADVGAVTAEQEATFTVDTYPDREFPAKVTTVRYASETVQGVVTYKAVLAIDNADLLLRPGMTATAEIKVNTVTDALLVPNAALRYTPADGAGADQRSFLQRLMPGPPQIAQTNRPVETGRERTIYLLRDGKAVATQVEIGVTDGSRTEIMKGELQAGDQVIVDQRARS
jgi:HlyD family secretion protein